MSESDSQNKSNSKPLSNIDPGDPSIERWQNGLLLIHDFISEEEEETMITAFHGADPESRTVENKTVKAGARKRISQHFGYHFDYKTFGASETSFTPLPKYMETLLPRLPIIDARPDQFTVQYYPPGAGIPPHVDTHSLFGEAIYSLSFGSSVPMAFRRCNASDARRMRLPKRSLMSDSTAATAEVAKTAGTESPAEKSGLPEVEEAWELVLPPRSLLIMAGPSRYGYTHGIRGRKTDRVDGETVTREGRYSITMRSVRRGEEIGCDCEFPGVCDARIAEEMAEAEANPSEA